MMIAQVSLQRPPFVQNLLFENPWPLVIVFLLTGVTIVFASRGRGGSRPMGIAGLLFAAALGVYALTSLVTTTREQLAEQTRELVRRAGTGSSASLGQLFAEHAVLAGPDGTVWVNPLSAILTEYEGVVRRHTMTHTIRSIDAEHTGGNRGRTLLLVSSRVHELERAIPTQWLFVWQRDDDGTWRVIEANFLRFGTHPPTQGMWR